MITLTFCSIAFRNEPIEAVVPRLAAIGYDAVEIFAGQLEGKSDSELADIRDLARDSGILIEVVSPYLWLTQDAELLEKSHAIARQTIHQARVLGAPKIRTFTDSGPTGIGSDVATTAQWDTAVSALNTITGWAPDLLFVVETHAKTLADQPDSTLKLLERVDSENLVVLYQPSAPESCLPDYLKLKPHVRHIHLHNLLEDGSPSWVEEGALDIPAFANQLKADGYTHSLSVEYCWKDVPWDRAESACTYLAPLLKS